MDMSRNRRRTLKPQKNGILSTELIHDVLGHMQSLLLGREVKTDIPDDLPPATRLPGDRATNLIENAIRYTCSGSPMNVSVQTEGDQMVISVADRGHASTDLERVFDKFYRGRGHEDF